MGEDDRRDLPNGPLSRPKAAWPAELVCVRTTVMPERAVAPVAGEEINPIHPEPAFAGQVPYASPITHGSVTIELLWEMLAQSFPQEVLDDAEIEIRFARPVLAGSQVEVTGRLDTATDTRAAYAVAVRVVGGDVAMQGRIILRRPAA